MFPFASTLYIEGKVNVYKEADKKTLITDIYFINNPILFLFQDIRYELNGVEIEKIKTASITPTIKSYLSLNENESKSAEVWGWFLNGSVNSYSGIFSVFIPLNKTLGFAEDYKKIIMNSKHELILLRSNTNLNALLT